MVMLAKKKTAQGTLIVQEEDGVRELYVNRALESAMYVNAGIEEPVFPYLVQIRLWLQQHPEAQKILLIGSGGFQLPRAYLYDRPEGEITCCEISDDMLAVSEEYFGLGELKQKQGFQLVEQDGFAWLEKQTDCFDVIINDAFAGRKPVGLDEKNTALIKAHLKKNGVYIINAVVRPKGWGNGRVKLTKRLRTSFDQVDWVLVSEDCTLYEVQNCLVFAR